MSTKPLFLILKKRWYDLIASGQKTVEYRKFSEHYFSRIAGKDLDRVVFQLGYSPDAPRMTMPVMKIYLGDCPSDYADGEDCFCICLDVSQITHL